MQSMQTGQAMASYVAPAGANIITTELIQKYLDENKQLILAILDNQNLGKLNECAQYQQRLQQNLMYLAAIADAQPQLPPPQASPALQPQPGPYMQQTPQQGQPLMQQQPQQQQQQQQPMMVQQPAAQYVPAGAQAYQGAPGQPGMVGVQQPIQMVAQQPGMGQPLDASATAGGGDGGGAPMVHEYAAPPDAQHVGVMPEGQPAFIQQDASHLGSQQFGAPDHSQGAGQS